jgi:SAM-dependent methyltransferase
VANTYSSEECASIQLLRNRLDDIGLTDWIKHASGVAYAKDPWKTFSCVLASIDNLPAHLQPLVDLFICQKAVRKQSVGSLIGSSIARSLETRGVLSINANGYIISRYCLLSCFGLYLFIEPPLITPAGRFVARQTYLSSGTYDFADELERRGSSGKALDIGSGSGLLTALLSRQGLQPIGIEIDPTAARLSMLNLAINGLKGTIVQCDGTSALLQAPCFDLIVVNPPWRIVPPGITYPNPRARVGGELDGLAQVRTALRIAPRLLTGGGEVILRFDLPRGMTTAEALLANPNLLVGTQFSVQTRLLGSITIETQAEISADTCAHLNSNIPNLKQAFLDHYRQLGVAYLDQLICLIRHKD